MVEIKELINWYNPLSLTPEKIVDLFKEKVTNYKNHKKNIEFQYIDEIAPVKPEEKQSSSIKEILASDELPTKSFELNMKYNAMAPISSQIKVKTITSITKLFVLKSFGSGKVAFVILFLNSDNLCEVVRRTKELKVI